MSGSNTAMDQPDFWNRVKNVKWEKVLIWAGFLSLIYLLKHLFFICFFTFVFCYAIRSIVVAIRNRIAPGRASLWLERGITLGVLGIVAGLSLAAAAMVVPTITQEFQVLAAKAQETKPQDVENAILQGTIGNYLFSRHYGKPSDDRFIKAMASWQQEGRQGEEIYKTFPALNSRLKREFERQYDTTQIQHLQTNFDTAQETHNFSWWFLSIKAPKLFASRSDYYTSVWQAQHGKLGSTEKLDDSNKDAQIRDLIFKDSKSDPVTLEESKKEWEQFVIAQSLAVFRKSSQYQLEFKKFYGNRRRLNVAAAPFEYPLFEELRNAYGEGHVKFLKVVSEYDRKEASETPAHLVYDFKMATKQKLAQQWWATNSVASTIREHFQKDGPVVVKKVGEWFRDMLSGWVRIPIQVATSFMFALLILLDMHELKKGASGLRNTRLRGVYEEVVPEITTLGNLLGKSFRGQAIIALFNATLMLLALFFIGIENKFLFAGLVFVFSFVPVIGVVLSGMPIILAAIMQPGGSLTMAGYVLTTIIVIHIIEGTVLGPKIAGKIGNLHPVLVMAILVIGEHFFGIWGLLLGVPVAIYVIRVVLLGEKIPETVDQETMVERDAV